MQPNNRGKMRLSHPRHQVMKNI